jgi:hypothetical protein
MACHWRWRTPPRQSPPPSLYGINLNNYSLVPTMCACRQPSASKGNTRTSPSSTVSPSTTLHCLENMVHGLEILGDPEEPWKVAVKYLPVVPKRFTSITLSIESLLDISTMLIEEIIGLRVWQRRVQEPALGSEEEEE